MARYDIYDGIISSGITLSAGTSMYIYSGGTANSTKVIPGGSMYISSGGTANNTTVYSGCIVIYSSGKANYTTLSSAGSMYISSGGTANNTTVYYSCYMYISSGGTANNTTVDFGGHMHISSGGTADSTTVTSRGLMHISPGGTATNVIWTPCVGYISAAQGSYVTYASNYTGVYFGSSNQLLSHSQTMNNKVVSGSMYVMNSGTANSTTVNRSGYMYISSGGTANSTTLKGSNYYGAAYMYVFSGGVANSTTVNYGRMYILSGGIANSTTVNSGGSIFISSGGTATDIIWTPCVGDVQVADGAYVTYASNYTGVYFGDDDQLLSHTQTMDNKVVSACSMYVMNSGIVNLTTLSTGGYIYISSGGTANSTTVNNLGYMHITCGGMANNTTVNATGKIYIYSGGIANNTTVAINDYNGFVYISSGGVANNTSLISERARIFILSGGTANNTNVTKGLINIASGGTHCGSLQIESGTTFYASSGAIIDFTVSERTTSAGYLINNLSLVKGTPTYTITVKKNQAEGTYKLAQGAENFTYSLTIGDGTVDYGTITVNGDDFVYEGVTYSLDNVNGNLTLTVSGDTDLIVDGDIDGNGYADTILVHTKQGYSGAWLATGTTSVIKWGSLSDVKSGIEILGTGRLYGSENDGQDIFFADSKSVGAWNVVEGKVTGYKTIMSVNATTNVLGLGDFNGDGATDLLLRSTSGDLGFYGTDGTGWEYLIGLGKEWSVAAVGDLNGDGLADTIVRHDAGFAGTFLTQTDGTVKWANLDTLKSDMTIVGTGDFNGDGVDDVLLQNKSNGWVGAWLVEDGRVDSFIGLCNNKNTIEQIADFNGDGIDDLRIRAGADIGVLYVNGADDTTWQYFQSVGTEWDTSFAALA